MKTASAHQRKGVARLLLCHMVNVATQRNFKYLLLETGTPEVFMPARKLYESLGFVECGPFADYKHDPYSVFMRRKLVADKL